MQRPVYSVMPFVQNERRDQATKAGSKTQLSVRLHLLACGQGGRRELTPLGVDRLAHHLLVFFKKEIQGDPATPPQPLVTLQQQSVARKACSIYHLATSQETFANHMSWFWHGCWGRVWGGAEVRLKASLYDVGWIHVPF